MVALSNTLRAYWSWEFSASMKTSILIFVCLAIFFIVMGIKFSRMDPKKDKVPTKGAAFLCVVIVEYVNNHVAKNLPGVNRKVYAPYLLGFASYLTFANISSVFGLTQPTTNLGLALTLSVFPFILFQTTGVVYQGLKNRIKGWLGPVPAFSFIILPISLIGEVTTPLSMGLRLFGNIFSGVVLSGIIMAVTDMLGALIGYIVADAIAVGIVAILLHTIFDVFFGVLQMYVYFMLTTMFVKQNME